jgi:heme exporter protein A
MLADLIAKHVQQGNMAVITSHQQVDIGGLTPQRLELTR